MIELSNGHTFEYMAASGALAFDGKGWPWERPLKWSGLLDPSLFTVVIKTLTFTPRKGNLRWYNPLGCIGFLHEGTVNAVDLTNPGIDWWCKKVGPQVKRSRISLVGSILSDDRGKLVVMASLLSRFSLVGLEINASCPNIEHDTAQNAEQVIEVCKAVKLQTDLPIILKLSVMDNVGAIVPQLEGVIEAISINSVPWVHVFPHTISPLQHLGGGGVSGKIAQPYTWKLVEKLVGLTSIPVIGPSIWEFDDIEVLRRLGAKAISFGSIFLRYPWRPTLFVRKDKKGGIPHGIHT